jgi:RNA 2',3'-cyclic 3'-phosphodiesterase
VLADAPAAVSAGLETARVFFALWPPPEVARRLAGIAREQAARHGGKATRADTVHLTLAFIGDVAVSRLPDLVAAAERVKGSSFALALGTCGYWSHNRLAWAGCDEVPTALAQLVRQLAQSLRHAGFRVDRASDDFVPHLTLVRRQADASPAPPIEPAIAWSCDAFVLVRSRLSAVGSCYEKLHSFPLDPEQDNPQEAFP